MRTKRTLYTAASNAVAVWEAGATPAELDPYMEALRESIEAEHRASAERVYRSRIRKMTPEQRQRALARALRQAALLREES
jgi:hypothetical protein